MTLTALAAQLREMATAIDSMLGPSALPATAKRGVRGPYKTRRARWTPARKRQMGAALRAAHARRRAGKPNGADHDTQPISTTGQP